MSTESTQTPTGKTPRARKATTDFDRLATIVTLFKELESPNSRAYALTELRDHHEKVSTPQQPSQAGE